MRWPADVLVLVRVVGATRHARSYGARWPFLTTARGAPYGARPSIGDEEGAHNPALFEELHVFGTPTFARTRLATVSRALSIRGVAREPQRLGVELERQHDGAAQACKPSYRIAHRPYLRPPPRAACYFDGGSTSFAHPRT